MCTNIVDTVFGIFRASDALYMGKREQTGVFHASGVSKRKSIRDTDLENLNLCIEYSFFNRKFVFDRFYSWTRFIRVEPPTFGRTFGTLGRILNLQQLCNPTLNMQIIYGTESD